MTVLPLLGHTASLDSETIERAYTDWLLGASAHGLARKHRVHHETMRRALRRRHDAARSPQQPPPAASPPPPLDPGVGTDTSPVGEAGGLRGAPAEPSNGRPEAALPGCGSGEAVVQPAGAPIVRRQLDEHGDTVYVFDLPAARYTTHAWSLVQEMLAPFDPATVRWINEED